MDRDFRRETRGGKEMNTNNPASPGSRGIARFGGAEKRADFDPKRSLPRIEIEFKRIFRAPPVRQRAARSPFPSFRAVPDPPHFIVCKNGGSV
jgi:hypothetical protein